MEFPPNLDVEALLEPFDELREQAGRLVPAWEVDAQHRRDMCRWNPLRFAMVYTPGLLSSDETSGVPSFSELHVDLADTARYWVPDPTGRRHAQRDAWVAPRGAAKSYWLLRILPLWALAYQHRRFVLVIADAGTQARGHAGNFRRLLSAGNPGPLLEDFPHLRPARRGAGARDAQSQLITEGGQVYAAHGIDEAIYGINVEGRPDVIMLDDIEPSETRYNATKYRARVRTVEQVVLPMSTHAVVNFSGVPTMYGSMAHDVVRAVDAARDRAAGRAPREQVAEWITGNGFVCHHYPAILDADTTAERSLWPVMWPLDRLHADRGTRTFAMNMDGHPPPPGEGEHWREDLFQWVDFPHVEGSRVMYLDVALTATTTSDYQAMAVTSRPVGVAHAVMVELAMGWKRTPSEFRDIVYEALWANPDIVNVYLESNAGGDLWLSIFRDMPAGRRLHLYKAVENKEMRINVLLDRYRRREVLHRGRLPQLEGQALEWPRGDHDDIVDAVAAGVAHFELPALGAATPTASSSQPPTR